MQPYTFLEQTRFSIRQAGIITKSNDPAVDEFADQLKNWLLVENIEVFMNEIIPELDILIILGGDGFCGWPTSLYLSDQGHDVVIVDNLSRRNIDTELGCDSLTPIQSPSVS